MSTNSKTILVTGAFGFLGRNVARKFHENGYKVFGIGHGKWEINEFSKWGIDVWLESTITYDSILSFRTDFNFIIHCGGSGSVGFSYSNPMEDFNKSVLSTISLLEYIRLHNPTCKLIYPSSPAVQGDLGEVDIKEDMYSIPFSPYGAHKKIAENLCQSYNNNFKINIGIIRFFSIYGEGLKKQLLWDACNKIHSNSIPSFFGTGNEMRDWIYISDAVDLIFILSNAPFDFKIINGGTGVKTKNLTVIKYLCKELNKEETFVFNGIGKSGDPVCFTANIQNALALGWLPQVSLEDGIKKYVDFFKRTLND